MALLPFWNERAALGPREWLSGGAWQHEDGWGGGALGAPPSRPMSARTGSCYPLLRYFQHFLLSMTYIYNVSDKNANRIIRLKNQFSCQIY